MPRILYLVATLFFILGGFYAYAGDSIFGYWIAANGFLLLITGIIAETRERK